MNVPWEIFATVFGALVALIVYTWRDLVKRVDAINQCLESTEGELKAHKLWASDNYIKKEDCKDHRDECPARKEALG